MTVRSVYFVVSSSASLWFIECLYRFRTHRGTAAVLSQHAPVPSSQARNTTRVWSGRHRPFFRFFF